MTSADAQSLVLGAGRSGVAAAALLLRDGKSVCLYDRDADRLHTAAQSLAAPVQTLCGPELPDFDGFEQVIASPGIPVEAHPRLVAEVDLAAAHLRAPLIGVTGTNGKSTTVVLIGEMLRRSGLRVAVGGNLGTALCELVGNDDSHDWVVAELSSFQLEHASRLRPRIAVLLNLAPDHLDRHGTLEAYAAAKAKLAALREPGGVLVANADDTWANAIAAAAPAPTRLFSTERVLGEGAWLEDDALQCSLSEAERLRVPLSSLAPSCSTHPQNALAASLVAREAGADGDAIRQVLEGFAGLAHRTQHVCTRGGVAYVDDSKATNPAAAAASLRAQAAPTWWLSGGRNKGLSFDSLRSVPTQLREVIVFGEAAPELAQALEGLAPITRVDSLDAALRHAAAAAKPGDVVLLSPACASFDQFESFEARGDHFARLARALPC